MKILSIVGARPQFIKLAPLVQALKKGTKDIRHVLVHTGQHYDYNMSKVFFDELNIPKPDYHLKVGSGRHGKQTGKMLEKIEKVLLKESPDWIVVFGDTNSTLAGALAGTKLSIPIAHVEAGLRSYNKNMPEEINRILTDHCSQILFCPTETAVKNLQNEGFSNIANDAKLISESATLMSFAQNPALVLNVGDIMYDSLLLCSELAEKNSVILKNLDGIRPQKYYLATIHRAENTDNTDRLRNIMEALLEISNRTPVIFPIHPRTKKKLSTLNLSLSKSNSLHFIDPVNYLDMLMLEKNAKKILTDSGGIQKEAYFLNVPCITLRDETEWKETVDCGWNIIVGTKKEDILANIDTPTSMPPTDINAKLSFGDGRAAIKMIKVLEEYT